MTAFALRHRGLSAAALGVAAGLAAAFAAAPWTAGFGSFLRRGYEAGLFAFFLC